MNKSILAAAAAAIVLVGCSVKKDSAGEQGVAGKSTLPKDFKLTTASMTLPDDSGAVFPPGPGVDAMNNNCRSCHSPSMVLSQPPLSHDDWAKAVDKMQEVFKAPIDDSAEPAILSYLDNLTAKAGGVPAPAKAATATSADAVPKVTETKSNQ